MQSKTKIFEGIIDIVKKNAEERLIVLKDSTSYTIDRRQLKQVQRRFKKGDTVKFQLHSPFVATIQGCRFDRTFFEAFYEQEIF